MASDDEGDVVSAQDYFPFGEILRQYNIGSSLEKYKFTGKERDAETNYDYFGARYYDPASGRWLSVDPLASKYPSLSPYVYCANNPLIYRDPDGRFINFIAAGIGAGVGGLIGGGMEYLNQVSGGNILDFGNYDFNTDVDWTAVGAASAEGVVAGAVAGATGGTSLLVSVGANAGAGVVGGMVKRAINGDQVINGTEMATDFVAGAAGGAAATGVEQVSKTVVDKATKRATAVGVTKKVAEKTAKQVAKKSVGVARGVVKTVVKKVSKKIQEITENEKDKKKDE